MKKLLAGILSLALAASMSVPAFAANTATNDGTSGTDITVNGTYQAGAPADDVISVDLVWDDMTFTYTAPSKGDWNVTEHKYENATAGGWAATSGTNPKITVTNHSNVEVIASFAFAADVSGLDGRFGNKELFLKTAENTTVENAPNAKTTFSLSGEGINEDKALGTITVTIGKFDTTPKMISSEDEFRATLNQVGVFKLANDIHLDDPFTIDSAYYVLDLNGHELSANLDDMRFFDVFEGDITIKNGSIKNTSEMMGRGINASCNQLLLENCEVSSAEEPITVGSPTTLMLSVNVRVYGGEIINYSTIQALPGIYNFDVGGYVDTSLYDVSEAGGIWTVTKQ